MGMDGRIDEVDLGTGIGHTLAGARGQRVVAAEQLGVGALISLSRPCAAGLQVGGAR